MPQFAYKARKRNGEVVEGTLEGSDRSHALAQISKMGMFAVAVNPARSSGKRNAAPVKKKKVANVARARKTTTKKSDASSRRRKPKMQELATFCQQLANLLESGMPLTVALNSMTHLGSKGIPSEVAEGLKQDVMEGGALSEAMSKTGGTFPDFVINMVRAGEQSGALAEVLKRLATHYQRFAEVQSQFVQAMVYPAVVLSVGAVIITAFMTFMLPKFLTVFEGVNVELPTPTKILIGISDLFSNYWWILGGGIALVALLITRYRATEEGGRQFDDLIMKIPVIGRVVRLNLFGQFARTLSTLLSNGVPVLSALRITEAIIPNRILKEAIATTREQVTDGKTLAEPLARSGVFPALMLDLLRIGEDTGDVPGALENVANSYENQLSIQLKVMTNLIEPVMIIFMAAMVAGLMYAVLSAMMAITSSVGS